MRHYPDPNDKYDREELERMNAQPWQVEQLKLNPDYVSWGPHEDYMWKKGRDEGGRGGWDARVLLETWPELRDGFEQDSWNECVHFYFALGRDSEECSVCAGTGMHPDAQWVSESWYRTGSPFQPPDARGQAGRDFMNQMFGSNLHDGVHGVDSFPSEKTLAKYGPAFRAFCEEMRDGAGEWCHDITQDEADALVAANRLHDLTRRRVQDDDGKWRSEKVEGPVTAEQVNAWSRGRGMGHDAINRAICIRRRLERLGLPHACVACDGHARQHTEAAARLELVLWWLHPRKGCSRGIEVREVQEHELPEVYAFLATAAQRSAERFAKVVEQAQGQGASA